MEDGQFDSRCNPEAMSETCIEAVTVVPGLPIVEIMTAKPVDLRSNSPFMLAVLFLVAKKLNIPRAWLVLVHPRQISMSRVRVSVVKQTPSDDTMEWLCNSDYHCSICGDVAADPVAMYADDHSDGCENCNPDCICQACHVHGSGYNYCLVCIPPDLTKGLDVWRTTRKDALETYYGEDDAV